MAALGGFAAINLGGGVGGAGGGAERAWAREAAESGLRRRVQAALALARAPGGGGEAVRAALEKLLQDPDLRQGVPERGDGAGGGGGGGSEAGGGDGEQAFGGVLQQLRFVVLRNLARVLETEAEGAARAEGREGEVLRRALECYLEAAGLDGKDVVLFHRMARIALKLSLVSTARFSLGQGLGLSPDHPLLLERMIEVCFLLGDCESLVGAAEKLITVDHMHGAATDILDVAAAEGFPAQVLQPQRFLDSIRGAVAPLLTKEVERHPSPGQGELVLGALPKDRKVLTLEEATIECLASKIQAEIGAEDQIVQDAGFEFLSAVSLEIASKDAGDACELGYKSCGGSDAQAPAPASTGGPPIASNQTNAGVACAADAPGGPTSTSPASDVPEEQVIGAKRTLEKSRFFTGANPQDLKKQKTATAMEEAPEKTAEDTDRGEKRGSQRRSRRVKELQQKETEAVTEPEREQVPEAADPEEAESSEEERDPQAVAAELQRYQMRFSSTDDGGAGEMEGASSPTTGRTGVKQGERAFVEALVNAFSAATAHGAALQLLNALTANLTLDFVSAAMQNSALEGVLLDLAAAVRAWDVLDHLSCLTMAELCMDYTAHMCHKNTKRQRRVKGLPPKTDFTNEIRALNKYLSGYDMGRVCTSAEFTEEEVAQRREKHEFLRVNWLRGNLADFRGARDRAAAFFDNSKDAIRSLAGDDEETWSLELPWCRHNGKISLKAIDSKVKHHVRYDALSKATRLLQSNSRAEAIEELVPLVLGEGTSVSNCKFSKHFMSPQIDSEELKALQVLFMALDDQPEELRSGRVPEIEFCCSVKMFYTFAPRNEAQWSDLTASKKKALRSSLHGFAKYLKPLLLASQLPAESLCALLRDTYPRICNLVQWGYTNVEKGKSSNMSLKMQERSISRSIFFDGMLSLSILQGANEATCGVKPGAEMSRDEFEQSSVLAVVLQGTRHVTYSHRLLSHVGYCCSEGVQILKEHFYRLRTFRSLLTRLGVASAQGRKRSTRSESSSGEELSVTLRKVEAEMRQIFFCLTGFRWGSEKMRLHEDCGLMQPETGEETLEIWSMAKPYIDSLSLDDLGSHVKLLKYIAGAAGPLALERSQGHHIYKLLDDDSDWEKEWFAGTLDLSKYGLQELTEKSGVKSSSRDCVNSLFWTLILAEGKVRSGMSLSNCQYEPGRILRAEGQAEVLEETGLYLSDLHLNPCRFDAWFELSRIYDDAKDLLQNDAARNLSVASWSADESGLQSLFLTWRRRSRRCLLIARTLAPDEEIEGVESYIGLCAYDSLQQVPPMFDQHRAQPPLDEHAEMNVAFTRKFFASAAALAPAEWMHPFFLGKVSEKDGSSAEETLSFYSKAVSLAPHALEPFYRLHAFRAKILLRHFTDTGVCELPSVAACSTLAQFCFSVRVSKSAALQLDVCKDASVDDLSLVSASLLQDCCDAFSFCLDVQKHYYPARYALARLFLACHRVPEALELLAFCFRGRGGVSINVWEEEGCKLGKVNKSGDKINMGHEWGPGMAPKKVSEIGRDESSRKYVYKLRKLFTMYAKCLGMTGDLEALQLLRKFVSKHEPWKSCLEDVSLMVLGEHLQQVAKHLVGEGLRVPRLQVSEEEGCVFTLELPEVNPSEKSVLLLKKVFDVCMETALRSEAPERALWSSKVQALRGAYEVFIRAPQFKNLPMETPVDPDQWQAFLTQMSIQCVEVLARQRDFEALEDAMRTFVRKPSSFKGLLSLVTKVHGGLISVSLRYVEALSPRGPGGGLDSKALLCLRVSFFLYRAAIWMVHVGFKAAPEPTAEVAAQSTEEVLLLGAFAKVLPQEAESISSVDEVATRVDAILKEKGIPVLALPRGFHFKTTAKALVQAQPDPQLRPESQGEPRDDAPQAGAMPDSEPAVAEPDSESP